MAQTKNAAFEKGQKLLEKKDYKGAKEAYSDALKQDSTLDVAYYNRALAEYNLKEMDAALLDFQTYNLLDPNDEDTMDYISYIYYYQDDYANLKASIQRFMKISSTKYNSNYHLGYACFYLDQHAEALEYLNNQLLLEPNNQNALYYRAQTYIYLGKIPEAENDFTKLIILKDDYPNAHYLRSTIRAEDNQYLGALEDLNQAIKQDSTHSDALVLRGDIHKTLGDSLAAKADFDRVIGFKDDNLYNALYKRGLLYVSQLINEDAAIADFSEIINAVPEKYPFAFFFRAALYTNANAFDKAENDFNTYSKTTNPSVELYYYWADLKYQSDQFTEALRLLDQYVDQPDSLSESNLAFAHQLFGKIFLQQKNYAQAMQSFEKSLAYDDEIGETHFWLGKTLISLKRNEEACTALHQALNFGYDDAEIELQQLCGYTIPLDEDSAIGDGPF